MIISFRDDGSNGRYVILLLQQMSRTSPSGSGGSDVKRLNEQFRTFSEVGSSGRHSNWLS